MSTEPYDDTEVPPDPQPGPEGDRTIGQRIRGNRRSLELTLFVLVLFGVSIFWTSHTASRVTNYANNVIAAACDFWYPLTSLPVTVVTGQKKPTRLSVSIITGARESYAGQCSNDGKPPMPPPDPSLVRWAHVYGLPVAQ